MPSPGITLRYLPWKRSSCAKHCSMNRSLEHRMFAAAWGAALGKHGASRMWSGRTLQPSICGFTFNKYWKPQYKTDTIHSFITKYFYNIYSVPNTALSTSQISHWFLTRVLWGRDYFPCFIGNEAAVQRSYWTCPRNMCSRYFWLSDSSIYSAPFFVRWWGVSIYLFMLSFIHWDFR